LSIDAKPSNTKFLYCGADRRDEGPFSAQADRNAPIPDVRSGDAGVYEVRDHLWSAARGLLGIFFCISGGTKLFVPAQFSIMEQTMVQSRIPFPHISALFASLVEFACGAGLALGLLTPLCALALAIDMIVAIATNRIHSIQASGVPAWLDDFSYLPEVLYIIVLVWLIFSGPGRYSIAGLMARRAGWP
jgi:putative oxidoreductase